MPLRSLLTHTAGISNDPLEFRSAYSGQHDPATDWSLLSLARVNEGLPPGTFRYTNTGFNILTTLTDRQQGLLWQDLIAKEILQPAGMSRSSARMSEALAQGWSVAKPHALRVQNQSGALVPISHRSRSEKSRFQYAIRRRHDHEPQ